LRGACDSPDRDGCSARRIALARKSQAAGKRHGAELALGQPGLAHDLAAGVINPSWVAG